MNPNTPLTSAERIREIVAKTNRQAARLDIRAVATTGSTNADLLAAIPMLTGPTFLVADAQTNGRGRAGRAWHTTPASAMTFSLAWPMVLSQSLSGLSLAIGVALAESLKTLGVEVQLKWPNDVLREGAKLAGILIEVAHHRQDAQKNTWVVAGVGLNLDMPDVLVQKIGRAVASAEELRHWDRELLLAKMLTHLSDALDQFEHEGFGAFVTRWNALHAYEGKAVVILNDGATLYEGIAVGIDDQGQFLMDTQNGRIAIAVGDVSLRLQEATQGHYAATY